jgi:hypothetical protein
MRIAAEHSVIAKVHDCQALAGLLSLLAVSAVSVIFISSFI